MNTNFKPIILHDVEDFIGKKIPVKAMVEITRMVDYSGYDGNFSIVLESVDANSVPPLFYLPAIEYKKNYNPEDPFMMNLNYDMRIYRKSGERKALAETEIIFKADDDKIYSIKMVLSITIKVSNNEYDEMMFSVCYLYAKEILESLNLSNYISKKISLPENYSSIDEDSKEFYDGYVVHRNHGRIKHVIKGGEDEIKHI